MKKLEAIIRPEKLEVIRQGLLDIGVTGMTILDAFGMGAQQGYTEIYRGKEHEIAFLAKVKLELVIEDSFLESAIDVISHHGRTGRIGDGKIFVSSVDSMVNIRTNEVVENTHHKEETMPPGNPLEPPL